MRTAENLSTTEVKVPSEPAAWTQLDRSSVTERANSILSSSPRPFIRWAGSKQRLLSQLVEHLPSGFRSYYEPFMGAGSMYFLLQPSRAKLNDFCSPLVEMYRTVSANAETVHSRLSEMDVLDKEYYYRVRGAVPTDPIEQAARFIYLNRAAWNGLYRVNARGDFNVPYGNPRSPNIVDRSNLIASSSLLAQSGTSLTYGDFEDAIVGAGEGDLVFLDPPYASSKKRESFVDYNETLFTWDDQRRLANCAESLRKVGAHVIVTNAYNVAIRELYPAFNEHALVRRSSLANDVKLRGSVAESVFVS